MPASTCSQSARQGFSKCLEKPMFESNLFPQYFQNIDVKAIMAYLDGSHGWPAMFPNLTAKNRARKPEARNRKGPAPRIMSFGSIAEPLTYLVNKYSLISESDFFFTIHKYPVIIDRQENIMINAWIGNALRGSLEIK